MKLPNLPKIDFGKVKTGVILRWVFMIATIIFIILLLTNGAKAVKKWFGLGDSDSKDQPDEIDLTELFGSLQNFDPTMVKIDFNPNFFLNDWKDKAGTFSILGRCDLIKRTADLNDNELAILMVAYQQSEGYSLRSVMTEKWWTTDCWFEHPETGLEKRMFRLEQDMIR